MPSFRELIHEALPLLEQAQNPQEVIALDQHGKIYYD